MATKISTGTFINLHGSNVPLRLTSDAEIEEISDQTYVGLLLNDKANNWPLNQANFEGNYNPVTGVVLLNECENCGKEIPADSVTQRLCEVCIQVGTAERSVAGSKAAETKALAVAADKKKDQEEKALKARDAKNKPAPSPASKAAKAKRTRAAKAKKAKTAKTEPGAGAASPQVTDPNAVAGRPGVRATEDLRSPTDPNPNRV